MRSALGRRLARVEQAAARRPTIDEALRAMSDEDLELALGELRRKIDAFHDPDIPDVRPRAHGADAA